MEESYISAIFVFQFRLGQKAAKKAHKFNESFGLEAAIQGTAQRWFKKFRSGDESTEDADCSGRPFNDYNDQLRALANANPFKTVKQLVAEFNLTPMGNSSPLKEIQESEKLCKWVSLELCKIKKTFVLRCFLCFFCTTITTILTALWSLSTTRSSTVLYYI